VIAANSNMVCDAIPRASDIAIHLNDTSINMFIRNTKQRNIIESVRLNVFMRLYFPLLIGLFSCSIGAFTQISNVDKQASPILNTGDVTRVITNSDINRIVVDIIKQRK